MNPKFEEALNLLQEECAEVIQIISKIRRFGLHESYNDKTNAERLTEELTDVQILINFIDKYQDSYNEDYADSKFKKLAKFSNLYKEDLYDDPIFDIRSLKLFEKEYDNGTSS